MTERPHQLTRVVLADHPAAWRRAGFDVDDSGRFALGRTVVTCTGAGGDDRRTAFLGWSLDGIEGDLDGLPVAALDGDATSSEPGSGTAPSTHPNGISSIDHVVVRTGDCDRTIRAFESAGLEVRGGRSTTSYGAPMRQTFFWAGDVILELVGPDSDPDGAAEPTTEEATSIFGIALVADDLDATSERMGELLSEAKDAVQKGRRIAGVRHRDAGIGLPVAVMSPHPRQGAGGAGYPSVT